MNNKTQVIAHPKFFSTQLDFRKWLEENHDKKLELYVGFHKVNSGLQSMTWSESVDQALCYGWIDGVRKSIDKDSYFIRFSPRKPKSIWSAINIDKVEKLVLQGLMRPSGLAVFTLRQENKSRIYSYEQQEVFLSESFLIIFKTNKKAWKYFQCTPASYQKPTIHWIMSGKQESTRVKRLDELMRDCEAGKKLKRFSY